MTSIVVKKNDQNVKYRGRNDLFHRECRQIYLDALFKIEEIAAALLTTKAGEGRGQRQTDQAKERTANLTDGLDEKEETVRNSKK